MTINFGKPKLTLKIQPGTIDQHTQDFFQIMRMDCSRKEKIADLNLLLAKSFLECPSLKHRIRRTIEEMSGEPVKEIDLQQNNVINLPINH